MEEINEKNGLKMEPDNDNFFIGQIKQHPAVYLPLFSILISFLINVFVIFWAYRDFGHSISTEMWLAALGASRAWYVMALTGFLLAIIIDKKFIKNILILIGIYVLFSAFLVNPAFLMLYPLVLILDIFFISLGSGAGFGIGLMSREKFNISEDVKKSLIIAGLVLIPLINIVILVPGALKANDCQNKDNDTNICYREKAKRRGDVNICENIGLQGERDICYQDIALGSAGRGAAVRVMEKTSQCDKIKNDTSREYCYSQVAQDTSNAKICDDLKILQVKDFCKEALTEASLCLELREGRERDVCLTKTRNKKEGIEGQAIFDPVTGAYVQY